MIKLAALQQAAEYLSQHPERVAQVLKTAVDGAEALAANSAVTQDQYQRIRERIRELESSDREDKAINKLVGRPITPGQAARYGAVGGALGLISHGVDALVKAEPGEQTIMEGLKKPKALAGRVLTGAIFAGGAPIIRNALDRKAAKEGWY